MERKFHNFKLFFFESYRSCTFPVTMMKVFCKFSLRAALLTQLRDIYSHLNAECRLVRGDQKSTRRLSEASVQSCDGDSSRPGTRDLPLTLYPHLFIFSPSSSSLWFKVFKHTIQSLGKALHAVWGVWASHFNFIFFLFSLSGPPHFPSPMCFF